MTEKYKHIDIERTAKRLKRCRKEVAHLSQRELGERLGISCNAVGQWERGISLPSLDQAVGLSKILGMEINGFIVEQKGRRA